MKVRDYGGLRRTFSPHILPVFIALISMILTLAFFWLHMVTPSDGARLEPGQPAWLPNGVLVTPLELQPGELQAGDLVVAIQGQELKTWANRIFSLGVSRPKWAYGQTIGYTIERENTVKEITITLGGYPLRAMLAEEWGLILFAFVSQMIASFVYILRPRDNTARILFIWAWSGSTAYMWSLGLQLNDLTGALGFWLYRSGATGLWILYWATILHFALIFPEPPQILKRFPSVIRLLYLTAFGMTTIFLVIEWLRVRTVWGWIPAISTAENLVATSYLSATLASFLIGYHWWWSPVARQRARWVLFGGLISGIGGLITWFLPALLPGFPVISTNLLGMIVLPFPITIAIAILRHNLFDIDVILNRALVYGALTGTLAVVYFTFVVLLQRLLPAQTQLTTALSTLTIAALFNPLRRRIQFDIDRLFYRRKYNAERTMAAFSATARDEVNLDRLSHALLDVVEEALQPAGAFLWLKPSSATHKPVLAQEHSWTTDQET